MDSSVSRVEHKVLNSWPKSVRNETGGAVLFKVVLGEALLSIGALALLPPMFMDVDSVLGVLESKVKTRVNLRTLNIDNVAGVYYFYHRGFDT